MWALIFSLCTCFTLIMSLAFCLCWRKKTPKNDLLGLDGMVTQKNPDENVNHLPSAAAPYAADGMKIVSGDCVDVNKSKSAATTNTRRSLPDIPSEQPNWEPTGDNSSEHYATVGQYHNTLKRHTLPNGVEPRSSISQHSSLSQADDSFSPYERVKYDKIASKEHPYAQVQPSTSRLPFFEENQNEEHASLLRVDGPSTSDAITPSRSRRPSLQNNLEIPAASAVAGALAASPELPYMTPPVTQPNFSGDSQDSSKGYTSICVREPLANIIAQTKEMNKRRRELDPHYATVSDDSDDVYTTIPDPNNQIYTSESETYARIPVTVEVEINAVPNVRSEEVLDETGDDLYEPAPQPQPPSVDSLKQVAAQSHSRQASSSSSVANLSSPKPEKRQANSPLPPPPTTSSFDFHADKLQAVRNLDDLYAKVHKNKRKGSSDDEKSPEKPKPHTSANKKANSGNLPSSEDHRHPDPVKMRKEHNYETLRKSPKDSSDPGYEKIKSDEPGYASINSPESVCNSDPGYEILKQQSSELDPNYEELQERLSTSDSLGYSKIKDSTNLDLYSVVNKPCKSDDKSRTSSSFTSNSQEVSLDEPNYESMPSESNSDPHYTGLKSTGSESDPNYESVKYLDEPPYEQLDNESSKADSDIGRYEKIQSRGYEDVDTSESSNDIGRSHALKPDPPYEQLKTDTDAELPGYERIKARSSPTPCSNKPSTSSKCDQEPDYSTIRDNPHSDLNQDKLYEI